MEERKKRLPDAELEVMQAVWQIGAAATSNQIWEMVKPNHSWALTTVLGFLTRLVDRGFLSVEKTGRTNWYTAQVEREEYLRWEGESLLNRMYGSSVKNFVASLYDGGSLKEEDLMELRAFLEERGGNSQ